MIRLGGGNALPTAMSETPRMSARKVKDNPRRSFIATSIFRKLAIFSAELAGYTIPRFSEKSNKKPADVQAGVRRGEIKWSLFATRPTVRGRRDMFSFRLHRNRRGGVLRLRSRGRDP